MTQIILKKDVDHLGYAGDVVKVKPGYARNFLIPQKFAVMATESNKKIIAENQRQAAHKIAKVIADAKAIADQLTKTEVKLPVKVGTSGKLFGSITTLQISRTLKELGFEVDRKDITLKDEIKEIGSYKISIKVHKDVYAEVNLHINREEEK